MRTKDYPNAELRRDTGIEEAVEHADFDIPGWRDTAHGFIRLFARAHPGEEFLCEDLRYWAYLNGCPKPPNQKAWGHPMQTAKKAGYIIKVGAGLARSSNLSHKTLWAAPGYNCSESTMEATMSSHNKSPIPTETEIANLLIDVLETEGWTDTIRDDVLQLVVQEASGSPQRAEALLRTVYDAPSLKEAQRIIALHDAASPMIKALNIIISEKGGWEAVRPALAQISDDGFTEATLILAMRYIIRAMNREESENKARRLWALLASFLYPAHSHDPKSVFYHAIGRYLWTPE